MNEVIKKSHISIKGDQFRGVTSTLHGHNVDAVVFNIRLVAKYYPDIAMHLMNISEFLPLYEKDMEKRNT